MYCYENIFKINPLWRREHGRLDRYTKMALLLNPNITTFWNTRKNLILNQYLEAKNDYLLTVLVLSQKPKCVEALTHRRWLYQHNIESFNWVESEFKLCDQLSNRAKCNYHAWSHRQWVYNLTSSLQGFDPNLWMAEFQASDDWTKYHISDHTGWHHRKFLLSHLKQCLTKLENHMDQLERVLTYPVHGASPSTFYASLLKQEFRKSEDLILSYIGHETLWYYRRFLIEMGLCEPSPPQTWTDETSFLNKCHSQFNVTSTCNNTDFNQRRLLDQHQLWLSRNWKH